MPSFKERFRPSRKLKKSKETSASSVDESSSSVSGLPTNTSTVSTSGLLLQTSLSSPTTTAAAPNGATIDDHTGSAALSTYHSHYSIDHRECKKQLESQPADRLPFILVRQLREVEH